MTLHPFHHATDDPHRPAIVMGSGETVTYGELRERACRISHLLRSEGVAAGDHIAIVMENSARFFDIAWAAQSAGAYYTPINHHLKHREVQHILDDCGASVLFVSSSTLDVVRALDRQRLRATFLVDGGTTGDLVSLDDAVRDLPSTPLLDAEEGQEMMYSGGTTGAPKGVRKPLSHATLGDDSARGVQTAQGIALFGMDASTVYLSPAPLYHAAPLVYCMSVHRLGGTTVVMKRFDPEQCLSLIEQHRVTYAQFVPTMFSRLLLPADVRAQYDMSSLQMAAHSAAPCPVDVKRRMIEWWGPILFEYYSGTEDLGFAAISSDEWLEHPGSVGKPMTPVHIVGDDGEELPTGEAGVIYFDAPEREFSYHNDPAKTAAITDHRGWRTLGDMGYLDADGYLYLTDRKSHMIISGGVNIYPWEVEEVLVGHPAVDDVAVVGVPDDDMGEQVKAVVEPSARATAGPDLAEELIAYCRDQLAAYKCPRTVDFVDQLPRDPNGKLHKRHLRQRYWEDHETEIA